MCSFCHVVAFKASNYLFIFELLNHVAGYGKVYNGYSWGRGNHS